MPPKAKEVKEKAVKGDEAEEIVLRYLKQVNRPYAATDVSANLKGKVIKTQCQKTLDSLAEKGLLTRKMYGKQSIFVYPQSSDDALSPEELADRNSQIKALEDDLEALKKQLRTLTTELTKTLEQPKTQDLDEAISGIDSQIELSQATLKPLRSASGGDDADGDEKGRGAVMTKEELAALDKEWWKWRKEWQSRKKIFAAGLSVINPDLPKSEQADFEESLGVEPDPEETLQLEKSELCKPVYSRPAIRLGAGARIGIGNSGKVEVGSKRKRS